MPRKCHVDITQAQPEQCAALLALAECVECDGFSSESLRQELRLAYDSAGWNLYLPNNKVSAAGQSKVAVDYAQPSFARRLEADNLNREFAVRAVRGRKKSDYQPLVLDATAGFGRDSFLLAASGCHVVQAERIPVLAYLLEQAL
ncbi:class I SAM-dependent methyltransferase, partial [Pseudomonadales bacterium]|nr:class I SAM-dependent methyltransferase [Pseudomonadales bacterium]